MQNSKEIQSFNSSKTVSQSLIIKRSVYYLGVESPHQASKFDEFRIHPLYNFPMHYPQKSSQHYISRTLFTVSDTINIKQTLLALHQNSPFSNSHSLREIIQESSLGFNPESLACLNRPQNQVNPYQSSIESFDFSDLSISTQNIFSKSIPQLKNNQLVPFDPKKEATLDTGLSFSSIKSDEVIFNSDNFEVSKIEWEEEKKFDEAKDDEILAQADEGPRVDILGHLFLLGETASKEKLLRKKSIPLFKLRPLSISAELNSPIIRKIVICQESKEGKIVQSREKSIEVKSAHIIKAIPAVGYLNASSLSYSKNEGKSKGFINYSSGNLISSYMTPIAISLVLQSSIAFMSCGVEHIAMVSCMGKVYTMGYGASGVLGLGDTLSSTVPRLVEEIEKVVYLECGAYHTVSVTENGEVWAWGRNDLGQLGMASSLLNSDKFGNFALVPLKVIELSQVKAKTVACGQAHTLVLDENGNVYSFGWGDDGQLGISPSEMQHNIMALGVKRINFLKSPIVKISAGATFSACISENGEIYTWGNGDKGQLGCGPILKYSSFPCLVQDLRKDDIIDVVCGESHLLCISRAGKVYGWGFGYVGNLGNYEVYPKGSEIVCFMPRTLDEVDIAHRVIMIKAVL